jgi:hypothetical protein
VRQPLEDSFRGLRAPRAVLERTPTLERRLAVGHDDQRRALARKPGDLHVSGVLPDVGIEERADLVRLFQVAAGDEVVEDHGQANGSDLDRRVRSVRQIETQHQASVDEPPRARDPQRNIGRERGR